MMSSNERATREAIEAAIAKLTFSTKPADLYMPATVVGIVRSDAKRARAVLANLQRRPKAGDVVSIREVAKEVREP